VAFLLFILLPLWPIDFHYFFADRLVLAHGTALLFFVLFLFRSWKGSLSFHLTIPDILLGLFYFSFSLSQAAADVSATGVLPSLLESSFVVIYIAFRILGDKLKDPGDFKVFALMICGSTTLLALWGLLQYFTGIDVAEDLKALFASHHLPVIASMGNPNFLSEFLVLAMPLTLAAGFLMKRFSVFSIIFLIQGLCIYLTYSRLAWAVFLMFMGISFFFARENRRRLGFLYAAALLAAGMLFAFHQYRGAPQAGRVVKNLTSQSPFAERAVMYRAACAMVKDSSFLGHGPGAFARDFPPYRSRAEKEAGESAKKETPELKHAHSDFLEIAYDNGFMALFFYCGLMGYGILRGLSLLKRNEGDLKNGAATIPLLVLPFSIWAFPFFLPFSKILFLFSLASVGGCEIFIERKWLLKGAAVLLAGAGIFAAAWQVRYMESQYYYNKGIDLFDRDMKTGREALEESVELFPYEGFSWFSLGSLLLNGGYREGIDHVEASLIFYADGPAFLTLARGSRDHDEIDASLEYYRRYLQLIPGDEAVRREMNELKNYHEKIKN